MKGKTTIKFIKSPTGKFNLAYFDGDVVDMQSNQAEVLIEAGYAVEYAPAMEIPKELPEDIPARDKLVRAGVRSILELRAYADLTEIPGIGKASAKQIEEYLKK